MKLVDLTCPKCGATFQVNEELTKCTCNYCGNEVLIDNENKEIKLTGGFEFGYDSTYGRLQAQHDFNKLHPTPQQLMMNQQQEMMKQQQEMYIKQTKDICFKKSWNWGLISGVISGFGIMLWQTSFKLGLIGFAVVTLLVLLITYKVQLKMYKITKNKGGH